MNYDLEERCEKFGEQIILFCRDVKKDPVSYPLVDQLIRSGTSIGANYMEANQGSSRKDFINKIKICQKEANETKHWLRMVATACPDCKEKCKEFWKESHELTLIFSGVSRSTKNNSLKIKN